MLKSHQCPPDLPILAQVAHPQSYSAVVSLPLSKLKEAVTAMIIWGMGQTLKAQNGEMFLDFLVLPSGELTFCHGKSPFFMGKSTISMAIFNCYVKLPEGNHPKISDILGASND